MVILSAPWSKLDYEFDWDTPRWLFAIVTGIITIVWNYLKSKVDDWESRTYAIRRGLERIEESGRTKEKSEEED